MLGSPGDFDSRLIPGDVVLPDTNAQPLSPASPSTTTERLEWNFRHAHRANQSVDREKRDGDPGKYALQPLCRNGAVFCQPKLGSTNHRRTVLSFSLWAHFLTRCMNRPILRTNRCNSSKLLLATRTGPHRQKPQPGSRFQELKACARKGAREG